MRLPVRSSILLTTLLLAALGVAFYLRALSPPAAARLLPECDAIVYANLKPLRAATHFDRSPVTRSPYFQQFIDATGIVPERDLDAAAFALHRMADPSGPNGPVAYSEVFAGHFDAARLDHYLAGIATARETYAGHTIFTIPAGDPQHPRTLRVTQLDADTIAVSNTPTPEQIHAMLDRHRSAINPFSGPTLLSGLYSEVPTFASAWAIGHVGLPFAENGYVTLVGLRLPLADDTTFIASLRYLGSVHLRVEAVASTPAAAIQTSQALSPIVALLSAITRNQTGGDPLRQALGSLQIAAQNDRVVLTANFSTDLLRHLATPDPSTASHREPRTGDLLP